MRAVDLIRKKRDAGEHSREEIAFLISGYTHGDIPDYQMAAWLMAALLRRLTRLEIFALTDAMLHSGAVVDLSALPGKKVDKHSTGGVGDNLPQEAPRTLPKLLLTLTDFDGGKWKAMA